MSGQGNTSGKNQPAPMMRPGGFGRRNMGAPVEKAKEGRKTFGRLMAYFKDQRILLAFLLFAVVLTVAGHVAGPGLQSRAIDTIVEGRFDDLAPYLAMMIGVYLVSGAATLLQEYLSASLSQRITRKMRNDLFAHIVRLPIGFIDTHAKGDLISRMTNDADNISNVISQSWARCSPAC